MERSETERKLKSPDDTTDSSETQLPSEIPSQTQEEVCITYIQDFFFMAKPNHS